MPKCSFCQQTVMMGRGKTFIASDGKQMFFCSSKCEKNSILGRQAKKLKWITKTKKVKEVKAQEMKA